MRLLLPMAYVFLIVLGKHSSANSELTKANENSPNLSIIQELVTDDERQNKYVAKCAKDETIFDDRNYRVNRDCKTVQNPFNSSPKLETDLFNYETAAADPRTVRKSKKRQILHKSEFERQKFRNSQARREPTPKYSNKVEEHLKTEKKKVKLGKLTAKEKQPLKNVTSVKTSKMRLFQRLKPGPEIPGSGSTQLRRPRFMNTTPERLNVQENNAFLNPLLTEYDKKEVKRVNTRDVNLILKTSNRNPKILIRRYKPFFSLVNYRPLNGQKRRPLAAVKQRLRQKRKQRRKRKKIRHQENENNFPFASGSAAAGQVSCNTENAKPQMSFAYPSYESTFTAAPTPAYPIFETATAYPQHNPYPVNHETNFFQNNNRLERKFPIIDTPLVLTDDSSIQIPYKHENKPALQFFDSTTTEEYKIEDVEEEPAAVQLGYNVYENEDNKNDLDENTEIEDEADLIQYEDAEPKNNADLENVEYEENTSDVPAEEVEYENDEQESAPRAIVDLIQRFHRRLPKLTDSRWKNSEASLIKPKNIFMD